MPQVLSKPLTKVVTKDGECTVTIALELTINLNTEGVVGVVAKSEQVQSQASPAAPQKEESMDWMLPDLKGIEKIKFGKIVGE
jgi:hypothetical protein